ncbi:hypothetical protein FQA39_LY05242 [Lamprigera yunnana]|nr:hypothetical protein FQA39_LY05242 [Lamprigera yunnana]
MPFTSEQDRFIVMAQFRSGTLNLDGNWSYSLQSCIEQFMQQYPHEMIEYDIFKQHKCRLVHRFETKNCICKGKSIGRPTVLTENVIENIQERINRSPKKAVSQLSKQTDLSGRVLYLEQVCTLSHFQFYHKWYIESYTNQCGKPEKKGEELKRKKVEVVKKQLFSDKPFPKPNFSSSDDLSDLTSNSDDDISLLDEIEAQQLEEQLENQTINEEDFVLIKIPGKKKINYYVAKPIPTVTAYAATIPLIYSAPWDTTLPHIKKDVGTTTCEKTNAAWEMFKEMDRLMIAVDTELSIFHDVVNIKNLKSEETTTQRQKRALTFIGDFSWCCGVETDRKIDDLIVEHAQVIKFINNLRQRLRNSVQQINAKSEIFNKYYETVSNNLVEVRTRIDNIDRYNKELKNIIGKGFDKTDTKIRIERLTVQAEVLNTCKDHKIPALIVQPLGLAADLTALEKDINSKNYRLAIQVEQLSKYYKLDIADCTVADQKIYIHIRVPIIQGKTEWKLYELITTPFAWNDETCIIMHDTLYIAVNEKAIVSAVKVISETALRHCKPYHDKLCYLPKFESDALFGPRCAYEMFIGATVEELRTTDVIISSGIYLETLPNISFYQTTKQILLRYKQPQPLYERLHCKNFCVDNEICNIVKKDYFNNINFNHIDQNENILEDNGELFDFQYATRSHVKRTFANNYDIAILLKAIKERENIIIIEGHYLNTLDNYIANMSCTDQKLLELVYLDYKQRVDWTRAFVNMCQTKRLQLDIVNFASVCPVSCRETGRQNQFISFVSSHRAWITHPKPGLRISCQGEQHQLNIKPRIGALLAEVPCYCHFEDNDGIDVYPTYPCVDKTIQFHIQEVLPAVWTKTPGLTLPSWDKTMPQFDVLNDCLNERWINANSDNQSTPIITYFVIANSIIIILSTLTYIYLHCKTQRKLLVDPNRKINPSNKKSFRFRSLKLSGPTMTFKRAQERSLPDIPNSEENEYLDPNEINSPRDMPRPPPNSPASPARLRPTQTKLSAKDEVKTYINLPQTLRVK